MKILSVLAASAIMFALAVPANALTVSNSDESDHTIAVVVGEARSVTTVTSGESLEVACDPNCTVSIVTPDGDQNTTEAAEADRLTIVKGGFAFAE